MKKITALSIAALVLGGIAFTACKKYEDGPGLTVLTKTQRVAGTWELEAYLENGVDKTTDYRQFVTSETNEFTKDGAYTMSANTILGTVNDAGTWEFINDKLEIKTQSNTAGADPDTMVILKLKSKEMWVTEKTPGSTVEEYHYRAK